MVGFGGKPWTTWIKYVQGTLDQRHGQHDPNCDTSRSRHGPILDMGDSSHTANLHVKELGYNPTPGELEGTEVACVGKHKYGKLKRGKEVRNGA